MRRTIGGTLNLKALAQLHRPTDRDTLRLAARELRSRGLTAADIAQALGLAEPVVRELIDEASLNG
jgi:DNA-binding transcriptional regulator LsrR (DeoR family)